MRDGTSTIMGNKHSKQNGDRGHNKSTESVAPQRAQSPAVKNAATNSKKRIQRESLSKLGSCLLVFTHIHSNVHLNEGKLLAVYVLHHVTGEAKASEDDKQDTVTKPPQTAASAAPAVAAPAKSSAAPSAASSSSAIPVRTCSRKTRVIS